MCSHISQYIRRSCHFGVNSPLCRRCGGFHRYIMKPVGKLHIYDTDITQFPICDHLPCLLDHLMSGISIGDIHHFISPDCQLFQLFCLFCCKTKRFFTNHMKSCLKRCLCNLVVGTVWRSHRYRLDTILSLCLPGKHGLIIGIASVFTHMQFFSKILPSLRINIKGTGHQLKIKISQCGRPVDITDLASFSSSNHCPANWILNFLLSVIHILILLFIFILFRQIWYPTPFRYATLSLTSRRLVFEFLGSRSCSIVIYPLYLISSKAALIPG